MQAYVLYAVLAGAAFGIWPKLLSSSGIYGNVASLMWTVFAAICILPFACRSFSTLGNANWWYIGAAGIVGAAGIMWLNSAFAKTGATNYANIILMSVWWVFCFTTGSQSYRFPFARLCVLQSI